MSADDRELAEFAADAADEEQRRLERIERRIEMDGPEGLMARKITSRFTGENDHE